MLLLKWKQKSEWLKKQYRELKTKYFWNEKKFVAVLFFGESNPSQVYVNLKEQYAREIWFDFLIFWQQICKWNEDYPELVKYQQMQYLDKDKVINLVKILNEDERCVWIICQLPLTEELKPYQKEIFNSISPLKDIDGLWDKLQKLSFEWKLEFLPATAQAIISLWNAYDLWNFDFQLDKFLY